MARRKRSKSTRRRSSDSSHRPSAIPAPRAEMASEASPPPSEPELDVGQIPSGISDELYHSHLGRLNDVLQESYNQHGKAILALTAGALGVSVAYLRTIASPPLVGREILLASWIFLIAAMIAILFSFATSQWATQWAIKLWDEEYETGETPKQDNNWSIVTGCLNHASSICFALGAISLIGFAYVNLFKEDITPSEVPLSVGDELILEQPSFFHLELNMASESNRPMGLEPQNDKKGGAVPPSRPVDPSSRERPQKPDPKK